MKGVYSLIRLGIVYEIHSNKVVVLTPDSEFLVIKRTKDMCLGQQVKFNIQDVKKTMKPVYKYASIASSIAAVFILVFMYLRVPFYDNVYGYINVDINPSIEFVVDKDFEVLQSKALNDDAKAIVKGLDVKGKDIYSVINDFIDNCEDYGYIDTKEDNVVLVSASVHDKSMKFFKSIDDDTELENFLISINKKINSNNDKDISGRVIKVSPEDRKAAVKNNLSMGKYYLMEKAKASGLDLSVEDMNKEKISDLLSAIDNKGSIITSEATMALQDQDETTTDSDKDNIEPTKEASEPLATPTAKIKSEPAVVPTSKPSVKPTEPKTKPTEEQKVVINTPTVQEVRTAEPSATSNNDTEINQGKLNIKLLSVEKDLKCSIINSEMHIINNSDEDIDLRDVTVRYYFTREGRADMQAAVYSYSKERMDGKNFKQGNSNDVKISFHHVTSSNMYMEIGFSSGVLKKNEYAFVNAAFNNDQWYEMNQNNDYSYIENSNKHVLTTKVTGYISGRLVWGKEPY